MQLLFTSSIAVPMISRWWKVTGAARNILLGIALRKLFGSLAPEMFEPRAQVGSAGQVDGDTEQEGNWHRSTASMSSTRTIS